MATYYYLGNKGHFDGPVNRAQLDALAHSGQISDWTPIRVVGRSPDVRYWDLPPDRELPDAPPDAPAEPPEPEKPKPKGFQRPTMRKIKPLKSPQRPGPFTFKPTKPAATPPPEPENKPGAASLLQDAIRLELPPDDKDAELLEPVPVTWDLPPIPAQSSQHSAPEIPSKDKPSRSTARRLGKKKKDKKGCGGCGCLVFVFIAIVLVNIDEWYGWFGWLVVVGIIAAAVYTVATQLNKPASGQAADPFDDKWGR